MAALPITFLSDYGYADEFAGVCRAVIGRIAPDAAVIDLTHGISRHAVEEGAAVLASALPFAPPGVHLAVIDPEVGASRRAVAVRVGAEDRLVVGPDNGLLWPAIDRFGGPVDAVDVSLSVFRLEPISATFHGRDVFAPVAAHLARGAELSEAGEGIDLGSLVRLQPTEASIAAGRVVAHVVLIDRYGNATLDLDDGQLPETGLKLGRSLVVEIGGSVHEAVFTPTFADVEPGRLILYEDSHRHLALAVNRGSASELLRLGRGDEVTLRAAE
ncbi:MAG TPA: SAM-dependent chlorinase/fluorinase [Solirubrobacterales bacterium]